VMKKKTHQAATATKQAGKGLPTGM